MAQPSSEAQLEIEKGGMWLMPVTQEKPGRPSSLTEAVTNDVGDTGKQDPSWPRNVSRRGGGGCC